MIKKLNLFPTLQRFKSTNLAGFTLLESLLVIAITAAIATVGFTLFHQRTESFKIDRTALQLQQLLQAGSAYFVDNNCWPNGSECQIQPVPNFNTYIPITLTNNPWGGIYQYHETTDTLKFQVLISDIPNQNLANRVVARLPNAVIQNCSNHGCTILAEAAIPAPPSLAPSSNYSVQVIKSFNLSLTGDNKDTMLPMDSFQCPDGWQAQAKAVISQISPQDNGADQVICRDIAKLGIAQIQIAPQHCLQITKNIYSCSFRVDAVALPPESSSGLCRTGNTTGLGTIGITGIGYCCKLDSSGKHCFDA